MQAPPPGTPTDHLPDLEQLFQQAPAALCLLDGPDLVYARVNAGYQQLFPDYSFVGRPWREVFPELVAHPVHEALQRVYHTGQTHVDQNVRLPLVPAAGEPPTDYYFDYVFQAYPDATGHPTGILVFAYEVTQQFLARQEVLVLNAQLRMQREETEHRVEAHSQALGAYSDAIRDARADAERQRVRLDGFFKQTQAAICILSGPKHVLDYCNPAYQHLFPGRELPQRLATEVSEAAAQGLLALLDDVYRTGRSYAGHEVPLTMGQVDGQGPRIGYFTLTCEAYREDGRIAGVTVFAYDVSAQVAARQQNDALRTDLLAAAQRQTQERATFHQVFEQTPAAICLLREPRHRFEYLNPAYQRLFPGRELLGRSLLDAVPEIEAQGYVALLDRVYRTGETYFGAEMPLVLASPSGGLPTTAYFNFTYQAFQENGQTAGISIFAYDVTEQVLARGQVQQLHLERDRTSLQLLRTNTDLDTFIYTASHDLRTPIANIEGLLAALREELPSEALQAELVGSILDRMQEDVECFQLTITQLTDVANLQQVQDLPAETVDLAALVADLRLDLATTGAALTVEVAACPRVSFAPKNLRIIVYNLLSNALKYRHPARLPVVELRCRSTRDAVVLEVQDNGLGLTEGQQAQLFGLFRRLHDHVAGTGIGLYMVKRLVENAGGTIAVQSQVGEGTTFTITLPGTN